MKQPLDEDDAAEDDEDAEDDDAPDDEDAEDDDAPDDVDDPDPELVVTPVPLPPAPPELALGSTSPEQPARGGAAATSRPRRSAPAVRGMDPSSRRRGVPQWGHARSAGRA
jgi:hypothetical protein